MFNSFNDYYPPKNWNEQKLNSEKFFLYDDLLNNYSDNDLVATLIKKNGSFVQINKLRLDLLVKSLVSEIKIALENKINNQLKLFSVLGASEESLVFMMASAYLGAHHSICFEELSIEAIKSRIEIFKPDIIFSRINNKSKTDDALADANLENVKSFVLDIENLKILDKEDLQKYQKSNPYYEDSPLFTLYTSGSTGLPKAIIHTAKKYLEYAKFTSEYFFNLSKGLKIFTATDAGWINGHTYSVYGPLACSAQTIIAEDLNYISDPFIIKKIISQLNLNCIYMSVTLLRIIRSKSYIFKDFATDHNYLERIGSCGEPLADEVGKWAIKFFKPKRKTIVNTYFQTETGGILVAPRDEDGVPLNYSSVGKPRQELGLFIAKDKLSNAQISSESLDPDEILISNNWSGIFMKVKSDREVKYFTKDGYFRLNDVGYFDDKGFLYIGGRSDDVINTAGHRISSSEIENICLDLKEIKEACVVAGYDEFLGAKPVLFISLNNTKNNSVLSIKDKLYKLIDEKLSKYHLTEEIYIFQDLPKTKSGKIMRRIMKELYGNLMIDINKDYSTLANLKNFKDSESLFFREKIDTLCKDNFNFNLKKFSERNLIKIGDSNTLPLLVITFIEKINRLNQFIEIDFIQFKIENKFSQIIDFQYPLYKDNSIKETLNNLNLTDLSKESCMLDIERLILRFQIKDNSGINIFFKKAENHLYNYKVDLNNFKIENKSKIINLLNVQNY